MSKRALNLDKNLKQELEVKKTTALPIYFKSVFDKNGGNLILYHLIHLNTKGGVQPFQPIFSIHK